MKLKPLIRLLLFFQDYFEKTSVRYALLTRWHNPLFLWTHMLWFVSSKPYDYNLAKRIFEYSLILRFISGGSLRCHRKENECFILDFTEQQLKELKPSNPWLSNDPGRASNKQTKGHPWFYSKTWAAPILWASGLISPENQMWTLHDLISPGRRATSDPQQINTSITKECHIHH